MFNYFLAIAGFVLVALLYRLDVAPTGGERWFLFRLLLIVGAGLAAGAVVAYARHFRRDPFYWIHGGLFAVLLIVFGLHVADYLLQTEMFATPRQLLERMIYLTYLGAAVIAAPLVMEKLRVGADQRGAPAEISADIAIVFGFCALYPVQHYIVSNVDTFTPGLMFQFVLVAALLPLAAFALLFVYVRPVVSTQRYFLINLAAATLIFGWYMRPLYQQFALLLGEASGLPAQVLWIHVPVFIAVLLFGYFLRRAVAPFLSVFLLLAFGNLVVTLATHSAPEPEASVDVSLTLQKRPSVYVLVVDGYQNLSALKTKGFSDLYIGEELEARGFRVYANAFSNYKPSVPSLSSFLQVEHHRYRISPDWEDLVTGRNRLFSTLADNGYTTVIAHPNDYLLQGHCNSDVCYPTPGVFGQIGFILAETIFFRADFADRTDVGRGKFIGDFDALLDRIAKPAVLYSHVLTPGHGPRGCSSQQRVMSVYERGLGLANDWLNWVIGKIDAIDPGAIILIFGDHGALLANDCTWSEPDVRSRDTIEDNLGVLLAVRWPEDYDGRYDARIHSPLDLSWFLLQYLSGDALPPADKPASASYLMREPEQRIYRVVQNGIIDLGAPGESAEGASQAPAHGD